MHSLTTVAHSVRGRDCVDAESIEKLVVVCLESLADLAEALGNGRRAERLLDAARLLRHEPAADDIEAELTSREWDVAVRVARGASNRQIAHELIVSERTVDTHVSHILSKLALVCRAQIAAWVARRDPSQIWLNRA